MPTKVQIIMTPHKIRVGLVIGAGKLKPVWFEQTDNRSRERIFIKEICSVWSYMKGNAKILNFSACDGNNTYRLSLNTKEFTWMLGVAESMA